MKFLLGAVAFLLWVGFMIFIESGSIAYFIDMPSLIGPLIAAVAMIVITGKHKAAIAGLRALISKKHQITEADRIKAIKLYKLMRRAIWCAAVLFFVVSLINIMSDVQNWELFMRNLAVAGLSVFYAVLINLILINPVIGILEMRDNK